MPLEDLPIPSTISLLLRDRASRIPHTPLISFCTAAGDIVDYDAHSLNYLTNLACLHYKCILPPVPLDPAASSVIGILSANSIENILTFLALQRLGHTSLLLSTRLAAAGIKHVLSQTDCAIVIVGKGSCSGGISDSSLSGIALVEMVEMETLHQLQSKNRVPPEDGEDDRIPQRPSFMLHSSGSTGLPKPLRFPHSSFRLPPKLALGMPMEPTYYRVSTLPLFHVFGNYALLSALQSGVQTIFLDTSVPITAPTIITAITKTNAKVLYLVPYVLRLIATAPGGINALKSCKTIVIGGAACPENLVDDLVSQGVVVSNGYGSTELGGVMRSNHISVALWNWMTIEPPFRETLFFEQREGGLWELCARKEFRLHAGEEARDKDGVFRSKDLWERHPEYPELWKHVGRADDLLVLENGENANPVRMEWAAEEARGVESVVVFGAARPYLGMFVLADGTVDEEEVLEEVWKKVEVVNREVPAYARIGKHAISVMDTTMGHRWHRTAKANIIRAQLYQEFASETEAFYRRNENPGPTNGVKSKPITLEEMHELVKLSITDALQMDLEKLDDDTNLFVMGVDSLDAISIRQKLRKTIDFGDARVEENVVFEHPTVRKLAAHLWSLSQNSKTENLKTNGSAKESILSEMRTLIDEFSTLTPLPLDTLSTNSPQKEGCHILLTGATGHLGSHILHQLLPLPNITQITCLVRSSSPAHAINRILTSPALKNHPLTIPTLSRKITALPYTPTSPNLDLTPETYTTLTQTITHIIHAAWSVNFNFTLTSFAPDLAGLQNLLRLAISSPRPPRFTFISSISTGLSLPRIPEILIPLEQNTTPSLGYAQAKLTAEHILARASSKFPELSIDIIRAGQLSGDTADGVWNHQEAWPAMISTALSLGVLPRKVEGEEGVGLRWLPVDVAAAGVVEIAGLKRDDYGGEEKGIGTVGVCNLVHPTTVDWEETVIPALRKAGMVFATVDGKEWVKRLKEAMEGGKVLGQAGKLVGHFEERFEGGGSEGEKVEVEMVNARKSRALMDVEEVGEVLMRRFVENWIKGPWSGLREA